jgi:hypothetical protein
MKFPFLGFSGHNESVVVTQESCVMHNVKGHCWPTDLPRGTDMVKWTTDVHISSHMTLLYVLLCSLCVIILNIQVQLQMYWYILDVPPEESCHQESQALRGSRHENHSFQLKHGDAADVQLF